MLGLDGIRLEDPGQVREAWKTALRAKRPVVIDAMCDPDVPPLPPHITFEQAKGFVASLFKGDPNLGGIMSQSAKQMMSKLLVRNEKS
jgi:pyruvate dehydrogenase (quinone)